MSEVLTQSGLAQRITEKTGVSVETAKKFANLFFSIVKRQLKTETSFSVYNFGTFKKSYIEESWGFNPSNGEKLLIPSHYRIKFVPCAKVARRINKKYAVLKPRPAPEDLKIDENESLLYKAEKINSQNHEKKSLLEKAQKFKDELQNPQKEEHLQNPSQEEKNPSPEEIFENQLINEEDKKQDEKELQKIPLKITLILLLALAFIIFAVSLIVKSWSRKSEKTQNKEENLSAPEEEIQDEKNISKIETEDELEISFEELVVQYGSCYHKLASEKYGNPHLWPYIYEANRITSPDPDLIISGKRLFVPEKPDIEKDKEQISKSILNAYNAYLLMCEKEPSSPKNERRKNLAVRVIVSGEILYSGFIDEYSQRILPEYASLAKNIARHQIK